MAIEVGIKSEHQKDCKFYVAVGHGQRGNSKLLTCTCPKVVYWPTDEKDKRGKTKMARKQFSTLADAESFQTIQQAKLNGNATAATAFPVLSPATNDNGKGCKTVRQAIVDFLDFKRNDYNDQRKKTVSEGHVNSALRPVLVKFLVFVNRELAGMTDAGTDVNDKNSETNVPERGVLLTDIEPEHVIKFRNQLKQDNGQEYSQSKKGKNMDYLAGFFNDCVELRYGISTSPFTSKARVPKPDTQEPKALSDAQVEQLFAAISKLKVRKGDIVTPTLPAVLLLMRWTGLGVGDAVMLQRSAIGSNGSEGFWKVDTARAKTGKSVHCTITEEVGKKVLAGARPTGRYLFVESVPEGERERKALVQQWGRRISQLGEVADIRDENGEQLDVTSHWLRHTFVRWCLDNNISTENIAALIGDTVKTVSEHYSTWIKARQDKLNDLMKEALGKKSHAATAGR